MPQGGQGGSSYPSSASCAQLDATAQSLLFASIAEGTRQAYQRTWKLFIDFHKLNGMTFVFPSAQTVLMRFIAFMHDRGYAPSSIISAVSAITFVHKVMGVRDPSDAVLIRKMLQGCKKLSSNTDMRLPITVHILEKVVQASQMVIGSLYARLRFQAMCTLAFHALLRVGEMTLSHNNLQKSDIAFEKAYMMITFRKFKHSTGAAVRHKVKSFQNTSICAVSLLHQYVQMRGARPGPVFLSDSGEAVSRSSFCRELKSALQFTGYPQERYNTHSFRIGAATHLASQRASDAQIRLAGRWSSNAFTSYIRLYNI